MFLVQIDLFSFKEIPLLSKNKPKLFGSPKVFPIILGNLSCPFRFRAVDIVLRFWNGHNLSVSVVT